MTAGRADGPSPEAIGDPASDGRRLDALIALLPEEFREVLILREMEDMSYREIADDHRCADRHGDVAAGAGPRDAAREMDGEGRRMSCEQSLRDPEPISTANSMRAEASEAERHLETCAECQALAADAARAESRAAQSAVSPRRCALRAAHRRALDAERARRAASAPDFWAGRGERRRRHGAGGGAGVFCCPAATADPLIARHRRRASALARRRTI